MRVVRRGGAYAAQLRKAATAIDVAENRELFSATHDAKLNTRPVRIQRQDSQLASKPVGGVSDADDGCQPALLQQGKNASHQPLAVDRFDRPEPIDVASNATLKHDT
jgi:hypothetical protein